MHDDTHLTDDAIDDYLGEALADATRRELEAHLGSCSACGARVARAAETELALLTLGAEARPRRASTMRRRLVGVAFAMVAAAAAVALLFGRSSPRPDVASAPADPIEPLVFADVEEHLDLPSSAELVGFVPESQP